jgi:hypothetical protein
VGFVDRIRSFRRSRRGAESVDVSRQGYPEEAPAGTAPDQPEPAEETPQRAGAKPGRKSPDEVVESGDGKATGNPQSAG